MHVALLHCQTVGIRCETCKWWQQSPYLRHEPVWGACLAADDPTLNQVGIYGEDDAATTLQVLASHFCALWEPGV